MNVPSPPAQQDLIVAATHDGNVLLAIAVQVSDRKIVSQIRSLRSLAAAKVPSPFPANTSTAPPAPLLTPSTRSDRLSLVIFAARSERGTPPL